VSAGPVADVILRSPQATEGSGKAEILGGACPEREEILRFAQNDRPRRAQNDFPRRTQNDQPRRAQKDQPRRAQKDFPRRARNYGPRRSRSGGLRLDGQPGRPHDKKVTLSEAKGLQMGP